MPKIYEEVGLVFFFYSSDLDEPPHVHVEYKEGGTMKVWLKEGWPVAWVRANLPRHKRTEALKIIANKYKTFLDNWYDFKQSGSISKK